MYEPTGGAQKQMAKQLEGVSEASQGAGVMFSKEALLQPGSQC